MDWLAPGITVHLFLLAFVAADYAFGLTQRLRTQVRQFEWDKARVAVRTGYYSLFFLLFFFAAHAEPIAAGSFSDLWWGLSAVLLAGFITAFMQTATEPGIWEIGSSVAIAEEATQREAT
jgi:hypothetical protein